MRILKDFKIPNFKFPKLKMKELSEIEELKVDYEAVKKEQERQKGRNYILVSPNKTLQVYCL